MEWSNQDLRELVNKRAKIVILKPSYGWNNIVKPEQFIAEVETKHSWSVHIQTIYIDQKSLIDIDDDWPQEWQWIFIPSERSAK